MGDIKLKTGATTYGALSTRMIITGAGNVGIGTTDPAYKFHLQGSNLMATFRNSSTAANQYTQLEFIAGSREAYIWLGNQNSTYWAGDGGLNIYTGTGNMDFWTAATQKMRLTASGDLGVGILNPGGRIHGVNNNFITAQGFLFEGYKSTYSATSPVVYIKGNWEYNTSRTTDPILKVAAYNDPNGFYILHSGNVGIGTSGPNYKLQVAGTVSILNGASDTLLGGSALYFEGGSGSSYTILQQGVGRFTIWGYNGSSWAEKFTINNTSGNVGIGTPLPGYKLDVSGTIRATGDVIAYSDARVKENVETLDGALDKVMKMRGVSYNKIGEQEKKVGVIAQEILEVLPEVVSQDETGTYSVAYGNIVSVLIEAIKEQQKQIDELKSKLK